MLPKHWKNIDEVQGHRVSWKRWLILAAVTVAVRIASTLAVNDPTPRVDADEYHKMAVRLVQYHAFLREEGSDYSLCASAFREPGFPLLVAAFYWVTGPRPLIAAVGIACIGSAGVLLFCYLVCRLTGRRDWMTLILAWLTVMLLPWVLRHTTWVVLMREDLMNMVSLGLLAMAAHVSETSRKGSHRSAAVTAALLGLLAGLGSLTKATIGPTVLVGVFLVWLVTNRRWALLNILCATAVAAMTITPWLIRNYRLLGTLSMTSLTGFALYVSGGDPNRIEGTEPASRLLAHDLAVGWLNGYQVAGVREGAPVETRDELGSWRGWGRYCNVLRDSIAISQSISHSQCYRIMYRMAVDDILNGPGRFARKCLVRFGRYWLGKQEGLPYPERHVQTRGRVKGLYQDLLRPAALIGLELGGLVALVLFRRQALAWMAVSTAVVNLVVSATFSDGSHRYRLLSDVMFAMLCVAAVLHLTRPGRGAQPMPGGPLKDEGCRD